MSSSESKKRDEDDEQADARRSPAFQDEDTGRVTLSLDGPPLVLPDELPVPVATGRRSSLPSPQHLDAWNADRLRRSSLPPSVTGAVFPSSIPANDAHPVSLEEEPGEGDLMALVGRARPHQSLDLVTEMTERFALGDFSGALRAAELLLGRDPKHDLGRHYARESRAKLEDMYTSRLRAGQLRVVMPSADVAWLGLDPQVTALLSQIEGDCTYEELLARCAMPRLWALRSLVELLDARVIRLV